MIEIAKSVDGIDEARLRRFLSAARRAAGVDGSVGLLLTSSREMQRLNRIFRRKNQPTDVLSFPAPDTLAGDFAGDIAISVDIAAANARELGHSAEDEIRVLMLHGLLHLTGYDHETDEGQMARRESRLRNQLGLPSSLIERTEALDMTKKRKPRSSSGKRRAG